MSFRIRGLDPAAFQPYFRMDEDQLGRIGARRVAVSERFVCPCRVTLDDAEPGETAILLNYEHLPVDSPYRSRHAIYVRESAREPFDAIDVVPPAVSRRLLSVRGFDANGFMLTGEVLEGRELAPYIEGQWKDPSVAYLHAHFARRGCFGARVDRITPG